MNPVIRDNHRKERKHYMAMCLWAPARNAGLQEAFGIQNRAGLLLFTAVAYSMLVF